MAEGGCTDPGTGGGGLVVAILGMQDTRKMKTERTTCKLAHNPTRPATCYTIPGTHSHSTSSRIVDPPARCPPS